jgi:hypothetical protein
MTKIKDLSVIETDWISAKIKELSKPMAHYDGIYVSDEQRSNIDLLEEIQSKFKPLEPLIKDVIDHSFDIGHWSNNELKPLELGKMLNREKELKEEIFELHFKEINL